MQKNTANISEVIANYHFDGEICFIKKISGGRANAVFLIENSKKYILKIQKNLNKGCVQAIGNELYVQKENEFLSKYMPNIYYLDNKGKRFGYKYVIMDYIFGNTLENGQMQHFYLAGKYLARIHEVTSEFIGKIQDNSRIQSKIDLEQYYLKYFTNTLFMFSKIDCELATEISKFIKQNFNISLYKDDDICLLHNDVHPRNIILSESDIVYIDWDCSKYANRELDFVKMRHFTRNNRKSISFFIDGYKSVKDIHFTKNYWCHEVIWLCKMICFDYFNKKEQDDYFPGAKYYKTEILKIIRR